MAHTIATDHKIHLIIYGHKTKFQKMECERK